MSAPEIGLGSAPMTGAASALVAAMSHVGPERERNEDAVLLPGVILGAAAQGGWSGTIECGSATLVQVIDGMGGHGAGSWASVLAASTLNELAAAVPPGLEPDQGWLASAIQETADTITDVGALKPATRIMGAATAGLMLGHRTVLAFNVGDCRVYVWEDGYLSLLTTDHRSRAGGGLTRSLGGTGTREVVTPDVVTMDRTVDRRYLLCSDGLTDTLEFEVLRELIAVDPVTSAASGLVAAAVDAGSHDNVTVAVVDVGSA